MSEEHVALITGYTGETGKALLKEILKNEKFKKIILVGRRKIDLSDEINHNKTEQREIDFEKIDEFSEEFRGADVHFCCLGTTRAKSGAEGFRRVDYDYIVGAARLAKEQGCKHFHLVSSQGANENAFFLYPKVKGQAELALTQMSFQRLSIYRPGVLMVDRAEHRMMERVAQTLLRHTVQRFAPQWITTPVDVLGKAMLFNSFTKDRPTVEILDNHAIFRLSETEQKLHNEL